MGQWSHLDAYAVGTLGAVAIAGLILAATKDGAITKAIQAVIVKALKVG